MKNSFLVLTFINLFFFNSAFSQSASEVKEKNIEVVLGIDKIEKLDFAPSTKVQVGNESILTYQIIPAKREVTFKGLKPGKTSVTVRNTVGDIKARFLVTVTVNDQSKVVQELKEFLKDVQGLEVGIKGNFVYVGGNIVVPSDIGKIVIILEKYPDVINLVELSPQSQRIIAKEMQEEIQKNGMRDVTVRVVNKLFWLEGIVTSEALKVRAEKIAVAYVPDRIESLARRTGAVQTAKGRNPIQNFISVNEKKKQAPLPKMVKISAQFVELTKDYNKIFGFKWEPTLSGDGGQITFGKTESGGVVTRSNGTLGGTIANLFPKLGSAKQAGYARVIQSGVILIQEGKTGKINKESEKSFALTSEFTQAAKAKAGFNLTVTPRILKEEKISLDMGISVSSSTGSPPEVLSNTISTSMVVKSKESAVVGGIVVNTSSTSFDKDHPFGEETADTDSSTSGSTLFSFLRSKSYQTTRSQFAVFVTPEIVESASQGTEKIKRKFRRRRR